MSDTEFIWWFGTPCVLFLAVICFWLGSKKQWSFMHLVIALSYLVIRICVLVPVNSTPPTSNLPENEAALDTLSRGWKLALVWVAVASAIFVCSHIFVPWVRSHFAIHEETGKVIKLEDERGYRHVQRRRG